MSRIPLKICRECGHEKPETKFKVQRKRSDGTYKRSNVCNECKTSTLSQEYPLKIEYTSHAKERCKLRSVDTSRLTRTLLGIKLSNAKSKYCIPNTPLVIVYEDDKRFRIRKVVTVIVDTSLRLQKKNNQQHEHQEN